MPGRKMLREIMSVNDIYNFAEIIVDMLREQYGSYDADALDEVQVEESFAQLLAARGYDVRPWGGTEAAPPPANLPSPAPRVPSVDPVAPVTIVRQRRTTPGGTRPTPANEDRPANPPASRTRRTTPPADSTRPTSARDGSRASSDGGNANGSAARPRRTTRTPRTNGSSES